VALPVVLLVVTMLFWGTAYRGSQIGAEHAAPIMVSALRAGVAAVALFAAAFVLRTRLPARDVWLTTTVTGLLMVTLTLEGITEGAVRAGAGNAAIVVNSSPFFVLLLARVFLGERASPIALAGLLVGFAGIVVMVSTQLGGIADTANFALGMGLALAAAVGWAVGILITKSLFTRRTDIDVVGFSVGQMVVGGGVALAIAFAIEGGGSTEWESGDFWAAVAWIGIGGSAIATLAFYAALRRLSATTVTAWQFLAPVVAVVTDVVYGTKPEAVVLAGMGLAIAGVAIVNATPQLTERWQRGGAR
jgi:probable blue pigment (indigoidine) exporter